MQCPKCHGAGKRSEEKPVSMTAMGTIEEDCDLCAGTGKLPEDLTPQMILRLDRIIGLLEKLTGGN